MLTVNDFAKLLGVEYGEKFKFADEDDAYASVYRLTEQCIECFNEYTNTWGDCDLNINFIFNKKIIKKPWKPKIGDDCYYISSNGDIRRFEWSGDNSDLTFYAAKNCFKTGEEAEKHKEEIINYLTSIYEKGNTSCDIK